MDWGNIKPDSVTTQIKIHRDQTEPSFSLKVKLK
jgi:hypothetical protein